MNDNRRREVENEEEYVQNPAKLLAPFLIGVAAALAGDTAMYFNWIAFAILCYVILAVSVVWIVRAVIRKDRAEYHLWRRFSSAMNEVEGFKERLDTFETNLNLKADKPARSNIRPGSVQSDRYKEMSGGEKRDRREENDRVSRVTEDSLE